MITCPKCGLTSHNLNDELLEALRALEESVSLQGHYARLLNEYDGGERRQFGNAREWIERLRTLRTTPGPGRE